MNKIRLWVLVIVTLGILTSCDSCDDGMDYPIVEYAPGITITVNAQVLERVRLALKAYPDIKILELRNGTNLGRIGNRGIVGVGVLSSLGSNPTDATIQNLVNDIITNPDNLSQLFGVPAGPIAMAGNLPAMACNLPATAGNLPAMAGNLPATAGKSPAMACNLAALAWNLPAMAWNAPAMAGA